MDPTADLDIMAEKRNLSLQRMENIEFVESQLWWQEALNLFHLQLSIV